MRRIKLLSAVLWTLLGCSAIGFPSVSQAGIHVSVNGVELDCSSDPTQCPIKGTYAGFTIDNGSAGPAQVVPSDSTQDSLTLQNAKITATGSGVSGTILFWADFSAVDGLPAAPPTVRFYKDVKGSFLRPATGLSPYPANPYASFTADAWVAGTEIAVPTTKYVICQPLNCGSIQMSKYQDFYSLTGVRQLEGQASFYLPLSGDQVNITYVQVHSVPFGEGPPVPDAHTGEINGDQADPFKGTKCECPGHHHGR